MKTIISNEKFDEAKAKVKKLYQSLAVDDGKRIEKYVLAVLDVLDHEVKEPPVMPGISKGEWLPCCGHGADEGKYYIFANGVKIAEVYSPEDRTFMAGSKEVTGKVIAYLESFGVHTSKNVVAIIDAIEKQGCNVDKFRG